MVTKGGRNGNHTQIFVSRDIVTSPFLIGILLTACGCHHRLLGLVFIVAYGVVVWQQAPGVAVVLESYDLP